MLKRFICLILSLVLLVGLIPAAAVQVSAASMATSDAAITILKKLEGFHSHCYSKDGAYKEDTVTGKVWYIGYGTKCTEENAHGVTTAHTPTCNSSGYLKDGTKCTQTGAHGPAHTIRENEADLALREEVKKIDSAINSFATNKGIALTQNQHDALVLFSYDNGTGWTKGTDDLQNAVVNGTTGNAFWMVMKNWKSGTGDDARRMAEANMYVNGVYSDNTSGVKFATTTTTTNTEGAMVTDDYVTVTVTNAYINVREKASIYGTPVGKVYYGDTLYIVRSTVCDANSYRWGEALDKDMKSIGFVALKYTNYDGVLAAFGATDQATTTTTAIGKAKVKVNGYVNVRSGAGTNNPIVSSLRDGVTVDLYDVEYVNGQAWGLTNVGWFSLAYAPGYTTTKSNTNSYGFQNFVFTKQSTNTKFTPTESMGEVKVNAAGFTTITEVTVRDTPEVSGKRNDTLASGTKFTVKKVKADKNTVWGWTEDPKYDGWVDLSTQYCTRDGVTLTAESSDPAAYALVGEVVNCAEVHVRNKASVYGTVITTLPAGTVVEVYYGPENGTAKTGWYAVAVPNSYGTDSFIRGDYLNVRDGTKADITYGKTSASLTSPDGTQAATGQGMVANTYGGVNVRTAPGTANVKVTKLLPGTVVDILEVTMYGSTKWGRIEQGWVCMDYIAMVDYDDLDGANTTITSNQVIYEGAVIGAQNVYKEPDRTSEVVRTLSNGEAITLHELLTVNEVTYDDGTTTHTTKTHWARVNDGYIVDESAAGKLSNVLKLDDLYEQVYTVTGTDLLKVRDWAGTDATREDLDLAKGDQVKITKLEIVGDQIWGMFENDKLSEGEGWICLSYCTKGAIATSDQEAGESGIPAPSTPVSLSIGNTGKQTYAGKIIGSAGVTEVNVRKEPSSNAEKVTDLKKGTAVTITETTLVDGRSWGYCGSGWINLLYVDLTPVGITAIDAKIIAVDNTLCYESSETGAKVVGSYANRAVVHIYEEMNGMYKTDMGWIAKGNTL